jgi:Arc/MetJ-type ribon-helix-helix transcriptional regulator
MLHEETPAIENGHGLSRSLRLPAMLWISIAIEIAMPTEQLLVRLPDDLLRRFKRTVPARSRSAFVRALLEKALPLKVDDNDPLYLAALAAEQDTRLSGEMAEWEDATIGDGLNDLPPFQAPG